MGFACVSPAVSGPHPKRVGALAMNTLLHWGHSQEVGGLSSGATHKRSVWLHVTNNCSCRQQRCV